MTPMMQQYMNIKEQNKDSILFFRMGDFYEMFFEDAHIASKVLNITLTSRSKNTADKIPMAGIPYHALDLYLAKMIKAGYKVAICEQAEDPKLAKGIVKRQVSRIVSPGTFLNLEFLNAKKNNYLVGISFNNHKLGLSYVDMSTGEFRVTQVESLEELHNELSRIKPSECLIPATLSEDNNFISRFKQLHPGVTLTSCDDWIFSKDTAFKILTNHFKTQSLDGFGCQKMDVAISAAGVIINYLKETQKTLLSHINNMAVYSNSEYMILDEVTRANLELLENRHKGHSLMSILDDTITPMGARMLRSWITQPLISVSAIKYRQDGVESCINNNTFRNELKILLRNIVDLERLIARLNCGQGNPRDIINIKETLKIIPLIKEKLQYFTDVNILNDIYKNLSELEDLTALIEKVILDVPAVSCRDGNIVKTGYNDELDELKNIKKSAKEWIINFQAEQIKKTGINSLKVKYNNVFGYYIEITKTKLELVPQEYIRKQTLVNCERFITPDLKEYEAKVLGAQEKIAQIEYEIFIFVKNAVIEQTTTIQKNACYIALLDVIISLATVAINKRYVRPEVNDDNLIKIDNGRHPVVETIMDEGSFIPNDILLDDIERQLLVITGPNMAGKSTYIRQAAIIVLMAQIGSFVPADKAIIGLVDRVFTRVGAQDDISKGQSTFMVEMNETANILNNATTRSLIILDEIGRGTSTFDGISIAWAVAEYIHEKLKTRTLFATHYHELTELSAIMPRVKNYSVSVKEWNNKIIFLRKIIEGGTDKSYGIHVAQLAGIPEVVTKRAYQILSNLEQASLTADNKPKFALIDNNRTAERQFTFFDKEQPLRKLVDDIKKIDINDMTPLEALNKLKEIQDNL